MADFVFNIAKGRIVELFNRVDQNDPTNAVLVWVPIDSTATDATLKDYDTLAAVTGDANTAEATGGGWARVVLDDTDVAALSTFVDDTNDRVDLDLADVDFGAITVGNDATHLLLCYDSDSTGGTDANIVPLVSFDFVVNADGSNVTAQPNAAGVLRST